MRFEKIALFLFIVALLIFIKLSIVESSILEKSSGSFSVGEVSKYDKIIAHSGVIVNLPKGFTGTVECDGCTIIFPEGATKFLGNSLYNANELEVFDGSIILAGEDIPVKNAKNILFLKGKDLYFRGICSKDCSVAGVSINRYAKFGYSKGKLSVSDGTVAQTKKPDISILGNNIKFNEFSLLEGEIKIDNKNNIVLGKGSKMITPAGLEMATSQEVAFSQEAGSYKEYVIENLAERKLFAKISTDNSLDIRFIKGNKLVDLPKKGLLEYQLIGDSELYMEFPIGLVETRLGTGDGGIIIEKNGKNEIIYTDGKIKKAVEQKKFESIRAITDYNKKKIGTKPNGELVYLPEKVGTLPPYPPKGSPLEKLAKTTESIFKLPEEIFKTPEKILKVPRLLKVKPSKILAEDDVEDIITFFSSKKTDIRHLNLKQEEALYFAVGKQESDFDTFAISPSGEAGIMQLSRGVAKEQGLTNIFDPYQNIAGGMQYFKKIYDSFPDVSDPNERLKFTLAAYNWGKNNVNNLNARAMRYYAPQEGWWDGITPTPDIAVNWKAALEKNPSIQSKWQTWDGIGSFSDQVQKKKVALPSGILNLPKETREYVPSVLKKYYDKL